MDCTVAYPPKFFLWAPSASSRFQSVPQRCFCVRHDHRYCVVIAIATGGFSCFFLDNKLDRFQPDPTLFVVTVANAEQGIPVLLHQTLCALLSGLQVGLCFHLFQHDVYPHRQHRDSASIITLRTKKPRIRYRNAGLSNVCYATCRYMVTCTASPAGQHHKRMCIVLTKATVNVNKT